MLKKCAILFLSLFAACGQTAPRPPSNLENWMHPNGKLKILSTTAMIDDLVGEIGGDKIDHLPLIIGEIDPHSYELVKGDDEKFMRSDLLFHNGLGLEHGASLRHRIDKHAQAIAVGDKIRGLQPEKILFRQGQVDPHIWMDIALWSEAIDPIVEALSAALPDEMSFFIERGKILKEKLLSIHEDIKMHMLLIPSEKRFLVTSHDAFHYFTKAYLADEGESDWQKRFIAPEGLAPEGQISPVDIQHVIDHLLKHHVNIVFPESNVSRDALRKIVEACQSRGLLVNISSKPLHGDAMGSSSSDTNSYVKMMQHNANVLIDSWMVPDDAKRN